MENVIVRPAQKGDMTAVYLLIRELALYEDAPEEVDLTLRQLKRDFKDKRFRLLVAEADETVCGIALFFEVYSTWKGVSIHLEDIIVTKEYRRRGVGSKLFEAVVELARKEKAGRLQWQVLGWNTPAINFYKRYGAILDSTWINGKLSAERLRQLIEDGKLPKSGR